MSLEISLPRPLYPVQVVVFALVSLLLGCFENISDCAEPCAPPGEDQPPSTRGELFLYNPSMDPEVGPRICAVTTPCADLESVLVADEERIRDVSFLESCDDSSIFFGGDQVALLFFDADIVGCDITIQELPGEPSSEGWLASVCSLTGTRSDCPDEEFSISSFPESGSTTFRIER